jgi:hypothetical protein
VNDFNNLTRRELLKISGLSIAGITFLAACGAQSGVVESSNIASAGTVPPTTALGQVVISDTVLLRTAASLEYNAIDTYTQVLDGGLLTGEYASLKDAVKRFRDDHISHAAAINALVVGYGGKAHECANTRVSSLYVDPALKLITADGNADAARDAVTLAHALENLAAQTKVLLPYWLNQNFVAAQCVLVKTKPVMQLCLRKYSTLATLLSARAPMKQLVKQRLRQCHLHLAVFPAFSFHLEHQTRKAQRQAFQWKPRV